MTDIEVTTTMTRCDPIMKQFMCPLVSKNSSIKNDIPKYFPKQLLVIILKYAYDPIKLFNNFIKVSTELKDHPQYISTLLQCLFNLNMGNISEDKKSTLPWMKKSQELGVFSINLNDLNYILNDENTQILAPSFRKINKSINDLPTYLKENESKWNDALICYINILNKYRNNYSSKHDIILCEWSYKGHRYHSGGPPQQSKCIKYMIWKFGDNNPCFGIYFTQNYSIGL